MTIRKLWIGFIAVMVVSFSVLLYFGREIYRQAPPVPEKVITSDGTVLFTGQNIKDGQNVWQSLGGQEIGTVWDKEPTRLQTGVLTGFIRKPYLCLISLLLSRMEFLTKI